MISLLEMKKIFRDPESFADQEVRVGGWVRNRRDSKTFGFLVLSDGTCFQPIQAVRKLLQVSSYCAVCASAHCPIPAAAVAYTGQFRQRTYT